LATAAELRYAAVEKRHVLVGSGLGNLLDPNHGGALLAELETRRGGLVTMGITLSFVWVVDDGSLPPHSYQGISIWRSAA
jgi:hypothetical protein